jgi:hypothetical protein
MAKRNSARARVPRAPAPARGAPGLVRNRNLQQQTRKILSKHYRAKYGVK